MTDPSSPCDAAHELISSARVEGTPVYDRAGEKLGTLHSVMIHKVSGQVAYALLTFGGFLGVPSRVHPIPWEKLRYDTHRHGYTVDLSRDMLENAPTLSLDAADRPSERGYEEALFGYYGSSMFW
ncbi:MAG: photosystem reaction center protein [Sphingomonas bacterium]|nr:photosystem reaction center protein [Sphingomonas bacterium]MDB5718862.1 photosystem reaction center protein [Sphingomonas bacterium]